MRAFWLASQTDGAPDYVVPYPGGTAQVIPALQNTNPYTMSAFLAIIRPLALLNGSMPAGYGA